MKPLFMTLMLALALTAGAGEPQSGWTSLFDGKTLDGWKASENPDSFTVSGGEIVVKGPRAHLFYDGPVNNHEFTNFEFTAEVMAQHQANSGVYFHTAFQDKGWPAKGYEVQINNTHSDPKKTAGLYGVKDNLEAPARDGEWFTLRIKVEGKHVITMVNDKVITDYTEEEGVQREEKFKGRLISSGTFALQGHDPGSEVHFKNIAVKVLP